MWRLSLLILVVAAPSATPAMADVPDFELSEAWIQPAAYGSKIFTLPNGHGHAFTAARLPNGMVVDATITLQLVDDLGNPIAYYPAEDIWLQTSGNSLVFAVGNPPSPDDPTNVMGLTHWTLPLEAGGCSAGETLHVLIAGVPLAQPGLELAFVSADLDGDLLINLADLSEFSAAYPPGDYSPCTDLLHDGVVNLGDLSLFSSGYFGR